MDPVSGMEDRGSDEEVDEVEVKGAGGTSVDVGCEKVEKGDTAAAASFDALCAAAG